MLWFRLAVRMKIVEIQGEGASSPLAKSQFDHQQTTAPASQTNTMGNRVHEKHSAISQSGIARASPTLFLGWNIVREG